MMYLRGNKVDFDEWFKLGNIGWDYENILPYFKKSEANHNPSFVAYKNGKYHSAEGPQNIDSFSADGLEHIKQMFLDVAAANGAEIVENINADKDLGYLNVQGYVFNGTRQSSAKAFLNPAKDRPNLHIIKNAFAQKILIKDKRAYGVEFMYNGIQKFTAIAKKEVFNVHLSNEIISHNI